jgi:hypothetical protein
MLSLALILISVACYLVGRRFVLTKTAMVSRSRQITGTPVVILGIILILLGIIAGLLSFMILVP